MQGGREENEFRGRLGAQAACKTRTKKVETEQCRDANAPKNYLHYAPIVFPALGSRHPVGLG
jgi:hypothetical protein